MSVPPRGNVHDGLAVDEGVLVDELLTASNAAVNVDEGEALSVPGYEQDALRTDGANRLVGTLWVQAFEAGVPYPTARLVDVVQDCVSLYWRTRSTSMSLIGSPGFVWVMLVSRLKRSAASNW